MDATSLYATPRQPAGISLPLEAPLCAAGWGRVDGEDAGQVPDLILLDGRNAIAQSIIDSFRTPEHPWRGTPLIVWTGGQAVSLTGASALVGEADDLPGALAQWAGPLDAHDFRARPWSPACRMTRLLGWTVARGMLARLADGLEEMVTGTDPELPDIQAAHRMAGLAGMMGYGALSAAWTAVEQGREGAVDEALRLSRQSLAEWKAVDGVNS